MKLTKKTWGVIALGAALVIPALAFMGSSQVNHVSASAVTSDAYVTDEQVFADAYKGLTADEVKTYVGYLDKKEEVNANIDDLLARNGGQVTEQTSAAYNDMVKELDRLDKELFLLEKKSWVVLEKERINGFTNVDEYVRQGLTDKLTAILELETKAVKSELTPTDKANLGHEYREFIATISYFDTLAEVEKSNLTEQEKDKLLDARLKVNELNRKLAELEYDAYYEVVDSDKAKADEYETEIDRLYKEEIAPLQKKAGIETPTEKLVW